MPPVLEALASHGVLGVICVILFWWVWKKDQDLAAERVKSAEKLQALNDKYAEDIKKEIGARVVDANNQLGLALKLQGEANTQTTAMRSAFDEMRKLMAQQSDTHEEREAMRQRPTITAPKGGGGRYGGGGE